MGRGPVKNVSRSMKPKSRSFSIITFNSTGKQHVFRLCQEITDPHSELSISKGQWAVATQEHWQQSDALPLFKDKLHRHKVLFVGAEATRGPRGGSSAGVGLIAPACYGIAHLAGREVAEAVRSRVAAAWISVAVVYVSV